MECVHIVETDIAGQDRLKLRSRRDTFGSFDMVWINVRGCEGLANRYRWR